MRKKARLIPPDNVKDILSVISILFFTSFLTAVIGTSLLVLFQIDLPLAPWLFASIWITGSIISNFTIAPILLPLYDRLRIREKRAQFIGVFSSLIISFTFFLVYITWITETDRVNSQFQDDSREMFSIINSEFQKEIESIQGIKAFYNASDIVERQEFSDFTKIYLDTTDSTISLAWLPLVKNYELADFEKRVQAEGFPNYRVFEIDPSQQKVNVSKRSIYYPVDYFAAEANLENEMGFDFGSNPSLLNAINMAQELGVPVSTQPINLHLSQTDEQDIYVIVPIYGKSSPSNSANDIRGNVIGYGVGNYDVEHIIDNALNKIKTYDIALFLYDTTDKNNPIFITTHPSTSKASIAEQTKESYLSNFKNNSAYREEFEIFGRTWMLVSFPAKEYAFKFFPNYSIIVLLFGLTLLIAYLVNSSNNERSENRIRKSESMFRSLSDSALTGIIRFNKSGEIIYTNDALAKIFGFERSNEFSKSNFFEFFEDPFRIKKEISTSKTGSSMLNMQFKIKNQNGDSRDILVSAGFYEEMISANILDITNLIQLNKEVQQLNHAIRQMADTVFITDDKGIIEYVNPAFEMKTGFSYGDSVGKHIKTIIKELSADSDPSLIWETLLDGNPHEFEYQTRLNNIEIISELISISPISDSDGKTIQFIGSGKDITDLRKARQEILDLNSNLEKRVVQRTSELEKAKKEMEAFSYSVSHDLRAPLRNMHGYSSILLDDYAKSMDSTATNYLLRIQEASVKMDNLIQDLLKLSQISKSACVRKKVDLIEFAKEIIHNLQNEEPNRNVSFVIPNSLVVWADADLISIAMNNLIRNAWKFTKKRSDAKIEIGSFFDEDEQIIYIKDNGAGFDMAFQNKLFGVFQRLHSGEEFEGTGIGLATVKRIIDHHGGRIWAEGEVGKGATFYFTVGNLEE